MLQSLIDCSVISGTNLLSRPNKTVRLDEGKLIYYYQPANAAKLFETFFKHYSFQHLDGFICIPHTSVTWVLHYGAHGLRGRRRTHLRRDKAIAKHRGLLSRKVSLYF